MDDTLGVFFFRADGKQGPSPAVRNGLVREDGEPMPRGAAGVHHCRKLFEQQEGRMGISGCEKSHEVDRVWYAAAVGHVAPREWLF